MTVARTVRRETLTWRPARKSGLWWIFRSVSTARPSAQRQKRRMPGSCAGVGGGAEGGAIASGGQRFELEAGPAEDIAREPAHTASPVFPGVLEDVGHLEALAARRRSCCA